MKRNGWSVHGFWEWEKTEEIAVFAMDDKVSNQKSGVIEELEELLRQFSIPLAVVDGNSKHGEDLHQILALLSSSMMGNEINHDRFEEELRKARGKGLLPYCVIVLIDKNRYEFYRAPGQQEPPIYGIGGSDGLAILRCTHREAVRHEFGHVLGLGLHHPPGVYHPGCVMVYACNPGTTASFCNECDRKIKKMWREEIMGGC